MQAGARRRSTRRGGRNPGRNVSSGGWSRRTCRVFSFCFFVLCDVASWRAPATDAAALSVGPRGWLH